MIEVTAYVDSSDDDRDEQVMTITCAEFPGDVVEISLGGDACKFSATDLISCLRAVSGQDCL